MMSSAFMAFSTHHVADRRGGRHRDHAGPSSFAVMSVGFQRASPPLNASGCDVQVVFTDTVRFPCATATELMRTLPPCRPSPSLSFTATWPPCQRDLKPLHVSEKAVGAARYCPEG